MRKIWLILFIICMSSNVFAYDLRVDVIGKPSLSEKVKSDSQIYGDVWLKIDEYNDTILDFDYRYDRYVSKLNVAQIKFMIPDTDIVVGRQQVGWGVGYSVNPIDIINPRPIGSSFDPSFVRDGRGAVVVTRYFGDQNKIELVYAGENTEIKHFDEDTEIKEDFRKDVGIKMKTNLAGFDLAVDYIDKGERTYNAVTEEAARVFGLEISGTIPVIEWGLWIETANYSETGKYEYVVGSDYYFDDYHVNFEYYKNGFGEFDKIKYDPGLLFRGRLMAQDYFIPSLTYTVDEKLTLSAFDFYNINDTGNIFGGVVDYFYNDNLEFILMPVFLSGAKDTEAGAQKEVIGNYAVEVLAKLSF